ncbi:ribonuclease P protein component [Neosynechococcus sphagnicola]|uniref:ribonuclease P protein component n=1 Tax=Neosynechococcus sphagnicola TaxID=1501145 RepID=UPI001EF9DF78|nr:ribonuclease P protein component [Neosynechococcus sphagnicola]
MSLPQAHRLRRRQDFSAVYQNGQRWSASHLTLRALRQTDSHAASAIGAAKLPTRFGISVSLKVSKLAVVRNRIKRWIRAVLRQLLPKTLPRMATGHRGATRSKGVRIP